MCAHNPAAIVVVIHLADRWRCSQQGIQQLLGAVLAKRVNPDLRVVGLAAPGVWVLRTVVDEQEHTGRGETLDKAVQQGLGLRVDPVEILED
jgi:hypothetical protein